MNYNKQPEYIKRMIQEVKHAYQNSQKDYHNLDNTVKGYTIYPGLKPDAPIIADRDNHAEAYELCKELYEIVLNKLN